MILFLITLGGLAAFAVVIQLVANMKIVGGNELGIVSGSGSKKGFRTLSGGRVFVIPFLQRFGRIDLTPITIEVSVDSAIASGIVPLNVKATVSFAIASNDLGRSHAVTRILTLAANKANLMKVASDIIEGHLRDSIASMTPEQVMQDKDTLVAKMINVCKGDLENIGLEITTMNIADVDDHRLPGVEEPDLYIALLKRIQSVAAETKARQAQAEANAASAEQAEARRAETETMRLNNDLARLRADTRVKVKEETQRMAIGVEQAQRDAKARRDGIMAQIEAEKQKIDMLRNRNKAEIVTPALAIKEKSILEAQAQASLLLGKSQAELDQMSITLETLATAGPEARRAYIVENFDRLFTPFAETLSYFPADRVNVITGAQEHREPLTAIHPDAIALTRNDMITGALASLTQAKAQSSQVDRPAQAAREPAPPAPPAQNTGAVRK